MSDPWIVRLNRVDVLTLSGVFLVACAIALLLSGRFAFALSALFLAMLVDAFDGVLARRYGLERDFGRYLDGFVDAIDYLIAPALFLYVWGFDAWYQQLILVAFVMCGIVRLSVFNQVGNVRDPQGELAYLGMPVFWSVLALGLGFVAHWIVGRGLVLGALTLLLPLYAVLMVTNRRFPKIRSVRLMLGVTVSGAVLFFAAGWIDASG